MVYDCFSQKMLLRNLKHIYICRAKGKVANTNRSYTRFDIDKYMYLFVEII